MGANGNELGEPSDEALIVSARAGDDSAFAALLRRHELRVLRVVRLLGVPAADREDVAQEVFIRVFRHLDGFRPGNPFAGWLYRIAVNASHDYRRRAQRRDRDEAPWSPHAEQAPAGAEDPAARVEERDRVARLERALGNLSERERAVFVLCEVEELTPRQVAASLGITQITVRRHLGRARRHLRRILEESEKKPPVG